MNNPVAVVQLPPHLQALVSHQGLASLNQSAAGGISAGSWPQISIKGSRFRLQDPQGQEVVVPDYFLDVVIVDANQHLSKRYYVGAYDPNKEGTAPDCYSDNGVAPSARSVKPQCGTCAACPHNVWGSKITPAGAQIKACADIKKVAVLIAANTSGPVFELDVPAASLTNFGAYIRSLDAAGIPAASIITRLQFDTSADYPKLLFGTPTLQAGQSPYITPAMLADVMEVIGTDEVSRCVGRDDKPMDSHRVVAAATTVLAQPAAALPPPPPVAFNPPPNPAFPHAGTPAHPSVITPEQAAQHQAAQAPLHAPGTPPASEQAPPKRTRSRKAAQPAAGQQASGTVAAAAQQPLPFGNPPPPLYTQAAYNPPASPPSNRDAQVPLNPPLASAQLDALITDIMRR